MTSKDVGNLSRYFHFFGSPEVERFSIALNLSDIVDFCTKNIFIKKTNFKPYFLLKKQKSL
jgi:hypothetical protein